MQSDTVHNFSVGDSDPDRNKASWPGAVLFGTKVSDTLAGSKANFFFQAEDGIRDTSVTGVQTCALPISVVTGLVSEAMRKIVSRSTGAPETRSEERRVGKECRYRWWSFRGKKK